MSDYHPKEHIINRFRVNPVLNDEFKKRRRKSESSKYCSEKVINSPNKIGDLVGFLPLILLVAILSAFVFSLFTIIKLALFTDQKDDLVFN